MTPRGRRQCPTLPVDTETVLVIIRRRHHKSKHVASLVFGDKIKWDQNAKNGRTHHEEKQIITSVFKERNQIR